MKPLQEALIDYDLAQLQGLAYKRGLAPPQARNRSALQAFAAELLSPVSMAIALDDLSAEEREALENLLAAGGVLEARKFARLYGPIRAMGSNKLLREKPWEAPANPAEGLWYRALIVKGFHHTVNGPEEIIFIPHEVRQALPGVSRSANPFQVSLSTPPRYVYQGQSQICEDIFNLLVYVQANFIRLGADKAFPPAHQKTLSQQFFVPAWFSEDQTATGQVWNRHWFDFVLQLARRLDFLRQQGQRLKLHTQTVRNWLQQQAWPQLKDLQTVWRTDPTWNDLWHIPGLNPKATGWENSPLLGRSKLLSYLAQLPPNEWIGLDTFVEAIKQAEPDFMRPDGDFESWYIYDDQQNPLMGFEHWTAVEGAFIRHIITAVLFAMNVVDLGAGGEGLPPDRFLITATGQAFLNPEDSPAPLPEKSGPKFMRINPADFTVRVPVTVSLYDRFQLARFARLIRREADRVVYQLSRETYGWAIEQSISAEQALAFLRRVTNAQVPLALVEAIRNWDRRTGSVKLERLTVLRVNEKDLLTELINHPQIGPLLDAPLGPKAILVPEKNVSAVRKLLKELGYGGDIGD